MGNLKTSSSTYRRGVPDSSTFFYGLVSSNLRMSFPASKLKANIINSIRKPTPTPTPTPIPTPTPTETYLTTFKYLNGTIITSSDNNITSTSYNNSTELIDVIIGTSCISLENYCFANCTSLTSIIIPNSVTIIRESCFADCTSLTSIIIPNSVTTIEQSCFAGCTSLTSVILSNSITILNDNCFYNCTSLPSIVIPNLVTELGSYCFYNCTGLITITFSNTLIKINDYCFAGCTSLESSTIPKSFNKNINKINNKNNLLTKNDLEFSLGENLINIGGHAFDSCVIRNLIILGEIAFFGDNCFVNCPLFSCKLNKDAPAFNQIKVIMDSMGVQFTEITVNTIDMSLGDY